MKKIFFVFLASLLGVMLGCMSNTFAATYGKKANPAELKVATADGKGQASRDMSKVKFESIDAAAGAAVQVPGEPFKASPGISFGSPTGFGASWGDVFAGAGFSSRTSAVNSAADGSAVVGAGVGNPDKYVGLEVVAAIISINTTDGGFGHDGNFGLKLHRNLPWLSGISIGAQNIGRWGNAYDEKETFYLSVTKAFLLKPTSPTNVMPLFITIGGGNGIYRNIAYQNKASSNDHYGVFAAAAWHFIPQMGIVADYNNEKVNAGISFVPIRKIPVTMTLGALDVLGRSCSKLNVAGTLGIVYNFA